MSAAVAETNSAIPSQPTRQRSGQAGQTSSSGDGFSGLVDGNLNAASDSDAASQPERPRAAQRAASPEPQGNPRTGIRRASHEPTATPAASPGQVNSSQGNGQTPEVGLTDAATAELDSEIVVATTAAAGAEQAPSDASDGDTEDADTTTMAAGPAAPPAAPTPGVVAASVAVQIELAADTAAPQIVAPGEAIPVANPPATIVAPPAGTAASALARVALDTAGPQTGDPATATQQPAQASVEGSPELPVAADRATTTLRAATAPTEAAATTTDAGPEAVVDAAAAQVQTPKAQAEPKAAPQADTVKPAETPQAEQIVANPDQKPATRPRDAATTTPEQPKADARADRRVEASPRSDDQPARPGEAELRPLPQRASHEQASPPAAHIQAGASEQQQPTGFGLSQPLHTQAAPVQTAQLTAIPVAANMPVPVGGLAIEIAANAQIGRSRFEIRLDPPELGRIDVRLDVDQKGQVTSHLIVEKSATLEMLRRDAPQLERALQDAGLKTSDNGLQFSLRDQQQQTGRNDDQGSGRNAQRLLVTEDETIAAETAGRSYGRMAGQRGGIDIRV